MSNHNKLQIGERVTSIRPNPWTNAFGEVFDGPKFGEVYEVAAHGSFSKHFHQPTVVLCGMPQFHVCENDLSPVISTSELTEALEEIETVNV